MSFNIFQAQNLLTLILFFAAPILMAQEIKVVKLPNNINTPNDEISPILSRDGNTMFFTRVGSRNFNKTLIENGKDLSKTLSKEKYEQKLAEIFSQLTNSNIQDPVNSKSNQDIWMATGKNFEYVQHPDYPLNNALPNSVCGIMPDESQVVVINEFNREGGMKKGFSTAYKNVENTFGFPRPIYITNYENIDTEVGMTMGYRGNIMLLSIVNKNKGDHDLYISFKKGGNTFSEPVSLGNDINTDAEEITPFLFLDNMKLYFASNKGGDYNIYVTKRIGKGWQNWTKPKMVQKINSKANETQPFYHFDSGTLYFASDRDGSSDIFKAQLEKPFKETVTVTGKVIDKKRDEIIGGFDIYQGLEGSNFYSKILFTENGVFEMELEKGKKHSFYAKKDGFLYELAGISFKKENLYVRDYEIKLPVEKIEAGTKLQVRPIYFKRSTATILEKSFDAIDELAVFLKKSKNIYIFIEGHTDNQGNPEALQKLSEARADAIKEYLVYKKFIKPVRITSKGLGPKFPLNDNKTEEERQKNRRVDIIVETVSILPD